MNQAGIKLKLSASACVDRQSLVVTDLSEDHNHAVDKVSIDVTTRYFVGISCELVFDVNGHS